VKTISWTKQTPWEDLLRQAEQEDVLLTRDGRAVALLMPFDDDDLDWYARERDPEFLDSIAEARRQMAAGKTISHADLKKELRTRAARDKLRNRRSAPRRGSRGRKGSDPAT
jgi:hypothetical protein